MELDARSCYRALRSRDDRFDGRFFTAVVTTGVYCRPVCPARTPRAENCRFFAHAAAAAAAGFRPCLRCRPEAAPGTPVWAGTGTTVARALRLIDAGALNDGGVDSLAARVGVGDRHLRRLFLRHVGATPLAVALTQRVAFAKQLLDDTTLPMSAVARAAGFTSIRRFNAAMQAAYRRPPSELRRRRLMEADVAAQNGARTTVTLSLAYRAPFDWDTLIGYLARRAIPGVETVRDGAYRRTFELATGDGDGDDDAEPARHRVRGVLEVRCDVAARRLRVRIDAAPGTQLSPPALFPIVTRLRQQFDLLADPVAIASALGADATLAPCVRRRPGLRVPGAWDGFELAVRAVLGQQVSVAAATTLAGRLARVHGTPLATGDDGLACVFPAAATLATANLDGLGITGARIATIRALATEIAAGRLELSAAADPDSTNAALSALPGIGPWTAAYIAMRVLRVPDAFPAADLGLRRAYGALTASRPGRRSERAPARHRNAPVAAPLAAATLERAAAAWQPWRAYAAVHLWTWEDPDAFVDG